MSEPAAAPDTGALSVDDAAALLSTPPEKKGKDPEPEPEADPDPADDEPEASAEPGEAEEPDEAADPEAAPPVEGEEAPADEPELPAIDPPVSWDAEAKADFAQLPRALQEKVAAREQQRETAVSAAQQRAANAEKIATNVTQLGQALSGILPQAQQAFKGKWDDYDWDTLAREDPLEYVAKNREYEKDQATLQQLRAAQQAAAEEEVNLFLAKREEELPQVAPELCGPEGTAKRTELSQFLLNAGIPADAISKGATAAMLSIALDAMKFRALKAEAPAAIRPAAPGAAGARTPAPPPAHRPVRPSTAPAQSDSRTRARDQAFDRLTQTGSIDDAVAAYEAKQKARR